MSNSPLFKRAFVRGLNAELIREGVIVYPSKEAADASADYVADQSGMPDPYTEGEALNMKTAEALTEYLVKAAEYQCEQAGNRYNPTVTKTAQESTPVAVATSDAWALLEKAASDTGSLIQGGDAPNTEGAAAKENAEAALDSKLRPAGYANLGEDGVGKYEKPTAGTVGHQGKHPKAPGATDSGSNSLTSKGASLSDIVRRVSEKTAMGTGSLIQGGDNANTETAAAHYNAEAAHDLKNRPEGYAHMGENAVSDTSFKVPPGAITGSEQPHPNAPKATASGTNSLIEHSKRAFDQLFEETAAQIVPYLPEKMEGEHKVAHVRALMGLEVSERADYLQSLYTSLGAEKTAAESVGAHFHKAAMGDCEHKEPDGDEGKNAMPPAMLARMEGKEEKKEAPKEEEKSASATPLSGLRARLQALSA